MATELEDRRRLKPNRVPSYIDPRSPGYYVDGPGGINLKIRKAGEDIQLVAPTLVKFIFDSSPSIPDYSPSMSQRFIDALRVAETYFGGREALSEYTLLHLKDIEAGLKDGFAFTPAMKFSATEGWTAMKIQLTDAIVQKTLVWNRFAQNMIIEGNIEQLFTKDPFTHALRPAEGTKLPVGNLVVEVTPGAGRLELPAHRTHHLRERWGFEYPAVSWLVMTHIMEKGMLDLAASIGNDMIDGKSLTPEVYAKSYVEILKLMDHNPQLDIRGVLSDGTWIYSADLARLFPQQHVSGLHAIAGDVVELGYAEDLGMPEQVGFATHDPVRRRAYLDGTYKVPIVARFIDRAGMEEVVHRFGLVS